MKNQEIKRNENNSQELTATEILKFLKMTAPLVEKCYQLLAKEYPCENEEDNFDFLHSLGENFITVPEWVQEETGCADTQFRFTVDSRTNEITLEPADEHDFCYLPDCVIERLLEEEIDMSDLYDAVDYEVNYAE